MLTRVGVWCYVCAVQLDADEAARQAHIAATRRVGRGGLNEQAAEGSTDDAAWDSAAGGQALS